jgi:hypothetical protein
MAERIVNFSDLSGQMIDNPEALVEVVVTDHPELDQPVRLEAMPGELELLGKLALKEPVVLDVRQPEEEEPQRYVLTVPNFNKLATDKDKPMSEILASAKAVVPPKPQRRSHNRTANGEPLRDFSTLEHAGAPHKGKVGEGEASLVRENLEAVNERLAAQGLRTIDPTNPEHAKQYGFEPTSSADA